MAFCPVNNPPPCHGSPAGRALTPRWHRPRSGREKRCGEGVREGRTDRRRGCRVATFSTARPKTGLCGAAFVPGLGNRLNSSIWEQNPSPDLQGWTSPSLEGSDSPPPGDGVYGVGANPLRLLSGLSSSAGLSVSSPKIREPKAKSLGSEHLPAAPAAFSMCSAEFSA